ncbi:MAG: hypothetical protein C0483_18605 [Pirellula sp.]|nr:hypothetical protein [Pirellula sp.]
MARNILLELTNEGEGFVPSHDYLLVKPIEAPGRTQGGIFLPNGSRAPTVSGPVILAGPGNTSPFGQMIAMDHKVGDVVVFAPLANLMEIKVGTVTYVLGRSCEVMGCIVGGQQQEPEANPPAAAKTVDETTGPETPTTFAVEASRN